MSMKTISRTILTKPKNAQDYFWCIAIWMTLYFLQQFYTYVYTTVYVLFVIFEKPHKKSRDRVNGWEEIGPRDFLCGFLYFQE